MIQSVHALIILGTMTDEFNHETMLKALISFALSGWLGARHESDALSIVVAQEIPDWQEKVGKVLRDPARRRMTEQKFAGTEKAVSQIVESQLDGAASYLVLQELLQSLHTKPN
jgi:hypothetical protein